MKLTHWILTFVLTLAYTVIQAQTISITGKVTDQQDGSAIPGVNILEKGTTNGTVTDLDGKYTLTVSSKDAILQISFIGYKTQEVTLTNRTVIDIKMSLDLTELDELVVIGYGVQKKRVATGAIATVKSEDIANLPVLRAEQAMQGRTAGVQITSLSGQPGESPTVRIRGIGSTGNSEPLYIVDGISVGDINFLNPADIESMDVLKDAASAAIYGARAANGVVLITTKSGKKGKINVTYSAYYGIQNPSNKLEMLNADQYREVWNKAAANDGMAKMPFDVNEVAAHNTNWQEELFTKNAPISDQNISITGGNEHSSYVSSVSYFSQDGIIGGNKSHFERISARFNSNHNIKDKITIGNNFTYSHIADRGISSNTSFNGAYSSALNLDPLTPLYEEDATILNQTPYFDNPVVVNKDGKVYGISEILGGEIVNPVALMEIQTSRHKKDVVMGNIYAELEILPGLKAKTNAGLLTAYEMWDSYRPLFYLNNAQLNTERTSVSKSMGRYNQWQWDNTIAYSKKIEEHQISMLVGTSAEEQYYEDLSGFNEIVPVDDPEHIYLNMASSDTNSISGGGANHYAIYSYFGRISYDYKGRYALNGIVRRDGSSNFGANYRFGPFPSVGLSWLITDEPFIPEIPSVDFLKLRFSWGINGNDKIGKYQYVSRLNTERGYIFGGGQVNGASPAAIENADIHWEESHQTDIAIDAGFFNNRLTATIDYYIKTTEGLLDVIPIPGHVGNDAPVSNVGSIENKGIEFSINWKHQTGDWKYSIGVNGGYNKNKMTYIGNTSKVIPGANWALAGMITRSEEGLPIAYFYGFKSDGIFQSDAEVYQHIGKTGEVLQPLAKPGDVRFVDVNNDGKLSDEDRTMIGNPTPDVTLGINGSVNYKEFDLSFLLTGAFGHEVFNGAQRRDLDFINLTTSALDSWSPENHSETIPRLTMADINRNNRVSDIYLEDGSFLKVKNLQLGYTFNKNFLNQIGADQWRIYVSAENLYTFTKYTGVDPEIGAMSSFDLGIDRGVYPQARTYRLGTTITF